MLAVYEALVQVTADAAASRPCLEPDRISFTVAHETARDQVTTATGILPGEVTLVGAIGHAVLDNLLSTNRWQRAKAAASVLSARRVRRMAVVDALHTSG